MEIVNLIKYFPIPKILIMSASIIFSYLDCQLSQMPELIFDLFFFLITETLVGKWKILTCWSKFG